MLRHPRLESMPLNIATAHATLIFEIGAWFFRATHPLDIRQTLLPYYMTIHCSTVPYSHSRHHTTIPILFFTHTGRKCVLWPLYWYDAIWFPTAYNFFLPFCMGAFRYALVCPSKKLWQRWKSGGIFLFFSKPVTTIFIIKWHFRMFSAQNILNLLVTTGSNYVQWCSLILPFL